MALLEQSQITFLQDELKPPSGGTFKSHLDRCCLSLNSSFSVPVTILCVPCKTPKFLQQQQHRNLWWRPLRNNCSAKEELEPSLEIELTEGFTLSFGQDSYQTNERWIKFCALPTSYSQGV